MSPDLAPAPPEPPFRGCYRPVLYVVYFDFDQSMLNKEGKLSVDKLVTQLMEFTNDTVVCIGHTDSSGTEEYNKKLGELRARAVKAYFVEQGIDEKRIGIDSRGESEPAVPNDSELNRSRNRRVTFEVTLQPAAQE